MRLFLFKLFFVTAVFTFCINAQVINGGFETWVSGEPLGWMTNNTDEGPMPVYPITQTTNANSGFYAVKGEVISLGPVPQAKIAPLLQAGDGESGFPFSSRPDKLTGQYMYEPAGGDEFVANVFIRRGENLLGAGTFTETESTGTDEYKEMVFNIGYMDSTDTMPDRIDIVFMIRPTDGIYPHEGSTFYVDDIPGVKILKPVKDELFVAGEVDTVLWTAGGAETINLEYSTDMGSTFHSFLENYPADSGKYFWDVPEDLLTRKAMIRIIDSDNPDKKDTSDVFKIKPWQLTRLDANDEYELFEVDEDGWSFAQSPNNVWRPSDYQNIDYTRFDLISSRAFSSDNNFSSANSSDHPSWYTFVDAFTIAQCYNGNPPISFNPSATGEWYAVTGPWGGSCYGFAVTSLLAFYHKSGLLNSNSGMGSFQNLYTLPTDTVNRAVINKYYTFQFGEPFDSYDTFSKTSVDARQLLSELKDMFEKDNGDAKILVYFNNNGSGGHAITPYKMERIGKTSTFNLRNYDSNVPGSENQIIVIDSAANNWRDNTGLGWGQGTFNIYLSFDSNEYLTTPQLSSPVNQPAMPAASISSLDEMKIYNQSNADVKITSSNGNKIEFKDSSITNEISGAVPKIPITGRYHPPIGYVVPTDNYKVELSNFTEGRSYVLFSSGSTKYGYIRGNAGQNETDIVSYNNGIGVKNPDQVEKEIQLQTIITGENGGKLFEAAKLMLGNNDSLHLVESNGSEVLMQNYGESTSYDLKIIDYSENDVVEFTHADIDLNTNSSHQIVPALDNLAEESVQIMIDNGNDGMFDDTISVSNEVTSLGYSYSSAVPGKFNLSQNYPNPFNPATTISFDLPKQSFVTLKVYNILGQEIAELVNEVKSAGSYKIRFDASNLSSGTYIYSFSAGEYVSTKKMVLIK